MYEESMLRAVLQTRNRPVRASVSSEERQPKSVKRSNTSMSNDKIDKTFERGEETKEL